VLQRIIADLGDGRNVGCKDGRIALDCSVRPTRQGHFCVSTTDFFFPLVQSPYLQGRIGAANVLSDLYALGCYECDFVLMLVAACRDMTEDEREICTREMIRGFRECCNEAGTVITGGQTVLNPWPIIGGVATAVVSKDEFIQSDAARAGDVVILTKPLGTQVAVNVQQWRQEGNPKWKQCLDALNNNKRTHITDDQHLSAEDVAVNMMHSAVCSMVRLNRNGAKLMLKYKARACTDVTGFGILGHAQNLSENQKDAVAIRIDTLPCISGAAVINANVFNFRLLTGYSAETSGGLMVCLAEEAADNFCRELKVLDGSDCWRIGRVVEQSERKSWIVEDMNVLDV
jgi:selenide,water dikinase